MKPCDVSDVNKSSRRGSRNHFCHVKWLDATISEPFLDIYIYIFLWRPLSGQTNGDIFGIKRLSFYFPSIFSVCVHDAAGVRDGLSAFFYSEYELGQPKDEPDSTLFTI